MGRVRPKLVKSVGRKLLERYPKAFTTEFEENKEKVGELADVGSKHLRNRVAGYITHLKELEREED